MARRVNFSYSDDNLSLDEIDKTYNKVLSSIETKYSEDKNFYYSEEFIGYTQEEICQERDDVIDEVEKEVSLTLFASVEASLRSDFINRCQLKKKDKLSKFYRSGYNPKKRIYTYGLSEVVMKGWQEYLPEHENLIKQVNDVFQYRNWLAHGRYWQLAQPFQRYDYNTLYALLRTFLSQIEPYLMVV